MRHQLHMNGGSGNVRKISELSQRVLQLHSGGNLTSNHNSASNGILGALAQLNAAAANNASHYGGADYSSNHKKLGLTKSCNGGGVGELCDDKGFLPAHFTPIITLSESNNNHINLTGANDSDGPPSPIMMSDDEENDEEGSSGSRNAGEFMSDSGIYEHEGIDLRVNRPNGNSISRDHRFNGRYMDDMDDDERSRVDNNNESDEHNHHHSQSRDDPRLQIANYLHRLSSHAQQMAVFQNASAASKRSNINNNSTSHNNHNIQENTYEDEDGDEIDEDEDEENNSRQMVRPSREPQRILPSVAIREKQRKRNGSPTFVDPSGSIMNKARIVVSPKESKVISSLYTERLRLQIEILRLRKRKLLSELRATRNNTQVHHGRDLYHTKLRKYNDLKKRRALFNSDNTTSFTANNNCEEQQENGRDSEHEDNREDEQGSSNSGIMDKCNKGNNTSLDETTKKEKNNNNNNNNSNNGKGAIMADKKEKGNKEKIGEQQPIRNEEKQAKGAGLSNTVEDS